MRILLDTNIFIPLEDSSLELDEKVADLNRLASSKHQLLIHPATLLDLNRDKVQFVNMPSLRVDQTAKRISLLK